LTFNLSRLSYSEICSIAQLRAAVLALSILWGKKKAPCQGGETEGILHLLTLLLKNERELAFMYLLSLNMNIKYTLMLWLVLGWVTSQITKMFQSHIQKKSVFWSREGALTNAKPTLHQELRPKLNSNQAILLVQPLKLVPMALQYVIVKTKLK
jgi:hypothetical protein